MSFVVSKEKLKLYLKDIGDSMLCERRWEGELSMKLTVGAVEDHTIVPTCCSAYLVDLEYFLPFIH